MTFRFVLAFVFALVCAEADTQIVLTSGGTYFEDFEANDGGWTSGGANSSWGWGQPVANHTSFAFHNPAGNNAWMTGHSTGNGYIENSDDSFLESPVFDFSDPGLDELYVQFDFITENEPDFEAVRLQYSIDGGTTWTTVGEGTASTVVNDYTQLWYNETYFGVPNSWSGTNYPTNNATVTISPGCGFSVPPCPGGPVNCYGINTDARHCLPSDVLGESDVRFRFKLGMITPIATAARLVTLKVFGSTISALRRAAWRQILPPTKPPFAPANP